MVKKIILAILMICTVLYVWKRTMHVSQPVAATPPVANENRVAMSSTQMRDLGIETQMAAPGTLQILLSTRGRIALHPDRLAHVLPKVSGVAIEGRKNIGDTVEAGDVLAVIESREMADIKANFLAALEKEKLTLALLERERNLHAKQISAEQDYLNASSTYAEAKINLLLAKQKLHAFGLGEEDVQHIVEQREPDLRIYEIRAPIPGTIISRHITQGEFIDNTSTIYEVADLSRVWIEIGVFPKDLSKVQKGQTIQVRHPYSNKVQKAEIIYVSPIVQEETITSKAVAEMANLTEEWRPGSFVNVEINTENVPVALLIPKPALQDIEGKKTVFVKNETGFEKLIVEIGKEDNTHVEITSGLHLGDEVVSVKTFLLKAELGKGDADQDDD